MQVESFSLTIVILKQVDEVLVHPALRSPSSTVYVPGGNDNFSAPLPLVVCIWNILGLSLEKKVNVPSPPIVFFITVRVPGGGGAGGVGKILFCHPKAFFKASPKFSGLSQVEPG